MAPEAVDASMTLEGIAMIELLLACRPDRLGLLRIDPDLDGLVVVELGGRLGCTIELPTPS